MIPSLQIPLRNPYMDPFKEPFKEPYLLSPMILQARAPTTRIPAASTNTSIQPEWVLLGGSGDLVSRVITKVTIVISTYNLNWGTYNPTY